VLGIDRKENGAMPTLVIYVRCDDRGDLDWLRPRCEGAVEEVVEREQADDRVDEDVAVWGEIDYDD
jgi:hypothetical protein